MQSHPASTRSYLALSKLLEYKCGANNIGKGTAGYRIAEDVYACLCK